MGAGCPSQPVAPCAPHRSGCARRWRLRWRLGSGGLAGRSVLDLYAGSGAVGLELLSRGAAAVTLVESDQAVLKVLRANAAAVGLGVGLGGAHVLPARAETLALTNRL